MHRGDEMLALFVGGGALQALELWVARTFVRHLSEFFFDQRPRIHEGNTHGIFFHRQEEIKRAPCLVPVLEGRQIQGELM